ncbi:kinase-like domain-containing protein, partial [Dipodascopsis uninucleata]
MFSSALKSLSSNIAAHYSVSPTVSFQAGPWSVYDAKRRGSGRLVSVFVFEKRKLDSSLRSSVRGELEEICVRLRKEASFLAKLRHPSVLEIVEPVEEGRSSITFVTERVTACLTSVIDKKAAFAAGARLSDEDVDEVEIQKGLLQLAKGLEFLHFSAGLIHLNLVPSSVFVNVKSDWKLSGFGFSEDIRGDAREYMVEQFDNRIPKPLQFDIDYAAPELVIDHLLDPANDMFSLGSLIHAIYTTSPPVKSNQNINTYKNTIVQSLRISYRSKFPTYLTEVLPQLLTRRPTERMSSRDFQESRYFDNILVNTIRFLDSFPAKTVTEKHAFMRGLSKVLSQFPNSVLQKKILPTLVDELDKDESLVGLILTNILEIGRNMSQLSFSNRILPGLKKMKDISAGQMVLLEKIDIVKSRVNGREFKDDIMPLIYSSLSSEVPSVQEKALLTMPIITTSLDFPTIKNELFPKVSQVFQRTSSLAVKVASITAFSGLVGGGLDKYTISEKLVPLLRAMKTREPAVIMKALEAYNLIVSAVDINVIATEILPHLWALSVSPLLKKAQFKEFMDVIRVASKKVETEQIRKLEELDPGHRSTSNGAIPDTGDVEADFEALVLGRKPVEPKRNGNGNSI